MSFRLGVAVYGYDQLLRAKIKKKYATTLKTRPSVVWYLPKPPNLGKAFDQHWTSKG